MAVLHVRPGLTKIITQAKAATGRIPARLEKPAGGLFPIRMASFLMDDYRIANGFPVGPPACDLRARTFVSAEGEILADRESARNVETDALVRWIADPDTYDLGDLRWFPFQFAAPEVFTTDPLSAPVYLEDYEYRFGAETFHVPVLNFDADSNAHFALTLRSLAGTTGYTVLLVTSLNSAFGNSANPHAGLWCPQEKTGGWMSVTLQGAALYLETDQTPRRKVMDLAHLLGTAAPLMLAMSFARPIATLYAACGPSEITSVTADTGNDKTSLTPNIYLGRTPEDTNHGVDMALMEVGIYGDRLTRAQVRAEFATLSAAYGGDR